MTSIGELELKDAGMWDLEWEARKESIESDEEAEEAQC